MMQFVKEGWKTVKNHFYIVIILFLYQLIWGFFLYRFIESVVVPILHRYPDPHPTETSLQLFYMEGQFQLTKTDMIHYYIWMLAGLFIIRMLLSPFINAGLLYSIHHRDDKGILFFKGIKHAWKPTMLFYWGETLLLFAPAYWLLPYFYRKLITLPYESTLQSAIPYLCGWIIYGWILHQLFLFMQYGRISGVGIFRSLVLSLKNLPLVLGVSLLLIGLLLVTSGIFTAAAFLWTGLLAIILQQTYHLVRSIFKVWTIASQYHLWHSKT